MSAVLLWTALSLPLTARLPPAPAALPVAAPLHAVGVAMYYQTPGLMEHIALRHNAMPALPPGVRYYASSPFVKIVKGHARYGTVTVRYQGRVYRFRVLFGDESQPADRAKQIRRGLVVELPYQAAHTQGWWRTGHATAVLEGVTP